MLHFSGNCMNRKVSRADVDIANIRCCAAVPGHVPSPPLKLRSGRTPYATICLQGLRANSVHPLDKFFELIRLRNPASLKFSGGTPWIKFNAKFPFSTRSAT